MSTDPYVPPKSELLIPIKKGAWVPDFLLNKSNHLIGQRWLAMMIDFIVCWFILFVLLHSVTFILGETEAKKLYVFLILGGIFLYFVLMEGLVGYTVGKFILRIRVVNEYGEKPGIPKAIIRTLFRIIEVNPLMAGNFFAGFFFAGSLAGIVAFFSKRSQRIGDMVADTYVIASKYLKQATIDENTN